MDDRRSYEEACRLFKWTAPDRCNIAAEAIDRHALGGADGQRTALIVEQSSGTAHYSFDALMRWSNAMANILARWGIGLGDTVGLMLRPGAEAAIALLGILKSGAVAAPVPAGLDAPALAHWLATISPAALIGDRDNSSSVEAVAKALPGLKAAMTVDAPASPFPDFWETLRQGSDAPPASITGPDDPALLSFDGAGEGALHGHRALRVRTSGAEYFFQRPPQPGDILWSLSDWASEGGWLEAVLPSWAMGIPVVVYPESGARTFPSARAVRFVHLPSIHVAEFKSIAEGERIQPRAVLVTGTVPPDDARWLRSRFDAATVISMGESPYGPLLAPAPVYGFETPAGAYGRPPPGYVIDVVDGTGRVQTAGQPGRLALHADSPLLPLRRFGGAAVAPAGRWIPLDTKATRDLDGTFWPYPQLPQEPPDEQPKSMPGDPGPAIRIGAPDPSERWR